MNLLQAASSCRCLQGRRTPHEASQRDEEDAPGYPPSPLPPENEKPAGVVGGNDGSGLSWGDSFGGMFGPGGDRVNSAAGGRRCLRDQSARSAGVLILRHGVNGMT